MNGQPDEDEAEGGGRRLVSFKETLLETLPLEYLEEYYDYYEEDEGDFESTNNYSRAEFSSSSSDVFTENAAAAAAANRNRDGEVVNNNKCQHASAAAHSSTVSSGHCHQSGSCHNDQPSRMSIDEESAIIPSSYNYNSSAAAPLTPTATATAAAASMDGSSSYCCSEFATMSVDSDVPMFSIKIAKQTPPSAAATSSAAVTSSAVDTTTISRESPTTTEPRNTSKVPAAPTPSCRTSDGGERSKKKRISSIIRARRHHSGGLRNSSRPWRDSRRPSEAPTASMTGTPSRAGTALPSRQSQHGPTRNNTKLGSLRRRLPGGSNNKNYNQRSSSPSSSSPQHRRSKTQRSLSLTKLAFFLFLLVVATATSIVLYTHLSSTESQFAKDQFQSIAQRAVLDSADIVSRKRLSMATMSAMISEQFRDGEEDWPNVAVVGYDRIVEMLARTGSHTNMGFAPVVRVSEKQDFEDFAYSYFDSRPDFPNTTGINGFGKGIWRVQNKTRVPDNDESTQERGILTPIIQCCIDNPGDRILMYNLHSEKSRRKSIDGIINCSKKIERELQEAAEANQEADKDDQNHVLEDHDARQAVNAVVKGRSTSIEVQPGQQVQHLPKPKKYPDYSCGSMTEFVNVLRFKTRGPASIMFQPIYPANNPWMVRGIVLSPMAWDEVFEAVFNSNVCGHAVLESEEEKYTYTIHDGKVESFVEGDIHDEVYDEFGVSVNLTWDDLHEMGAPMYKLSLYPDDIFLKSYSTSNPRNATTAALSVIIFITILFLLYDYFVRRAFMERHQLLEAKRRFIRFVSHEVRTPLNAVLMGLHIIEAEMEVECAAQQADRTAERLDLLREIQNSAESAVDVLNDVLLYDKIESSIKLDMSMVPIWDVVERTLSEFRLPAARRDVNLRATYETSMADPEDGYEAGLRVKNVNDLPDDVRRLRVAGDASRIAQVLRNLLSNALKFTNEEGLILVTASYHIKNITEGRRVQWKGSSSSSDYVEKFELHNGEEVVATPRGHFQLFVQDTGVGMTEDQIGQLFGEGVQFNANTLQAGKGSGLGLFIARGLVEQHKGTLDAMSEGIDKGSTFTLKLPLYHVPGLSSKEENPGTMCDKEMLNASDPSWSEKKLHLLVVDNAPSNRKLLCRLLEHKGHSCDMAENGQVALEMVRENMLGDEEPYDSILMDYEMPVMNGPTASGMIRELGSDVFIIGITGNVLSDDVQYFKSKGVNAILPKPLQLSSLEDLFMEYHLTY